jgi:hypothetical protein
MCPLNNKISKFYQSNVSEMTQFLINNEISNKITKFVVDL